MEKRVLVIGSTGAMGQYLVPELLQLGYAVTAVSLDDETPISDRVTCVKGDAFDVAFLKPLLAQEFDGIVNFMDYGKHPFSDYYRLFLDHTKHYIFLSSCRVYADEEVPVRETSPRLLDVSKDEALLASDDYCIQKAQNEDLLWASDYKNFTIVRPATTFSHMRFQLTTLEAPNTVGRAMKGKKVVLPLQAKDKPATLSWGGDVARMIAHLLFKQQAMREAYNVCSAESRTWGEIAEYYHRLCGLEAVWVDKEDYLRVKSPNGSIKARWQLEYARMFRRITDNSKVLALTGLRQEDCMPLFDALKMMIDDIPEGYVFPDNKIDARMDAYLEEKGL
ncbi:MAG: NAD-dependent epimerase/dehydratase family protein [Oscillospiraceae bacterium]|nr:NAD-dependent epimerase/dehydratase family protein [Oscillospiraceae bacterium]